MGTLSTKKKHNHCAYTLIIIQKFLCMSVKIFLMTKVLKCIFWGCIFDVRLWFEMYFLREQFWCAPMFLKCIFSGSNFEEHLCSEMHFLREQFWCAPMFLKCIFSGSNFEEHLCSEMHFLREQLFWSLWLLISVAAALCFHGCWLVWLLLYIFYQSFHHKYNFCSIDMWVEAYA